MFYQKEVVLDTAVHPIQAECGKAMFAIWLLGGKILELPESINLYIS